MLTSSIGEAADLPRENSTTMYFIELEVNNPLTGCGNKTARLKNTVEVFANFVTKRRVLVAEFRGTRFIKECYLP